jgi:hypothetical protein
VKTEMERREMRERERMCEIMKGERVRERVRRNEGRERERGREREKKDKGRERERESSQRAIIYSLRARNFSLSLLLG